MSFSIDLRSLCPPVQDQADMCCGTAMALVAALFVAEKKRGMAARELSCLFLYRQGRAIENKPDQDTDISIESGCTALTRYGCCEEPRLRDREQKWKK